MITHLHLNTYIFHVVHADLNCSWNIAQFLTKNTSDCRAAAGTMPNDVLSALGMESTKVQSGGHVKEVASKIQQDRFLGFCDSIVVVASAAKLRVGFRAPATAAFEAAWQTEDPDPAGGGGGIPQNHTLQHQRRSRRSGRVNRSGPAAGGACSYSGIWGLIWGIIFDF